MREATDHQTEEVRNYHTLLLKSHISHLTLMEDLPPFERGFNNVSCLLAGVAG